MALTRSEVEEVIRRRLAPSMSRADMTEEFDGKHPIIGDAITFALMELAYNTPVKFTDPEDTDLTQIPESDYQRFLGVCEWRVVKTIIGNLDDTDEKIGPVGQWNSQFVKQMERYLDELTMRLSNEYGWGPTTLSTGTWTIITTQREAP